MLKRTMSGAAIVGILLLLLLFSDYIVYSVGLAVLATIAVYEMLRVMGAHKKLGIAIPSLILTPIFPILSFAFKDENRLQLILILAAAAFCYMLLLMSISVFSKGKIPFSKSAEVFCAVTYIMVSFTSLVLLRYVNDYGYLFFIMVFLITWISDVFAYLIGSKMGKHKLIPEVSPKKSVEGAVAGVVFAALFCLLFGLGVDYFVKEIQVNYLVLGAMGVILSIVSQIGDLIASVIKREHGAKDYGKILPGHGGIMDRFDSVLAISTIMLIICLTFPPFTVV